MLAVSSTPINESNQMLTNTNTTAQSITQLSSLIGQIVWAPRNAGELIYWPATVVSAPFESMDASMSSKIQSVQIQYYGPPSQLATVPLESLQIYGRGELAEQHVQSVVNPVLVQLLEEAINDANNHINKSVTLTSNHNNNAAVTMLPSLSSTSSTPTTPKTTPTDITTTPLTSSSVAAATSTTTPSVMSEPVSVTKTEIPSPVAAAASSSEAASSSSQVTSSSSSSSSSTRLPPGLHVRILQPGLLGQIGVILHAPGAGSNDENYTVRALFNNLSYQLPRQCLEEWEHADGVNAAITQANASGGANAAATAAAAISAAHQAAQAAMFTVYQQQQQQQSFASAEPYIGQAVRVTKGEASGRTGTIIAWQPEYYAFRVRLGSEEVLKRNDELELLTAPVYRSVLPQQPGTTHEASAFHPINSATSLHVPPAHTPAASTRAQQPVLVTPNIVTDKKRKTNLPRSKSVRNLVGKYVMIEAGRYKGEIGFVAKGGNGYYGVIKLPGPNDPIIETQPVMKRSADLSLIQLTPEQRAEHERGVAKYFPHLVPPPSSPTLDSSSAPTASPIPLSSESVAAPSPLPSASPIPSPLTITGSPARPQRHPVSSPTPSEITENVSDEETNTAPAPITTQPEEVEEPYEVVDKVSKKKRKAQVTAVTKTESWVDRRVLVTVGKYRGEVGTIVKSGHGFYCVDIPNRGEVMKRAAELELYDVGGTIPVTHGHAPASDAKVRAAAFILIDLLKDHQAAVIQSKRAKLNHDDADAEYEEPMTTVFGRPAAIRKVMATAQAARESKTPLKSEVTTPTGSSTTPLPTSPSLMGDAASSTTSVSDDNDDIVGVDESNDDYYYSIPSTPARRRGGSSSRGRLTLASKKAFRPRYINAAGLAPL